MRQIHGDVPIVEFQNITKAFSGIKALDDVSFAIKRGEVHCLLGENGAGKSTLMKILTGVIRMDSGQILFNGEKVNIQGIKHAQSLGIGTVFQENSLMPHLSIAENIFLTREPRTKIGAIDYKTMHEQTAKWGQELGL